MATYAPDQDLIQRRAELDDDERRAWASYREGLRDLTGDEYEQAEHESWARLQDELADVAREREALEEPAAAPGA